MPYVTYTKGRTSDRCCRHAKNEHQAFLIVKRWMSAYIDSCVDFVVDKKDVALLEEYWKSEMFISELIATWNRMFSFRIEYFPEDSFFEGEEEIDRKFPEDLKNPTRWL